MNNELTETLLTLIEAEDPNIRASQVKATFTQTIYLALLHLSCSVV